ncbi:hypothetical protein ZIOFF_039195 [Zingiber officinale]|uniref:Uncharacterized protein n=1 Tax=Zingiber officinale TaxID=94328 RepID=A0A8J5G6T4_ZINOF|nr:hypothetical protein ZIOFF_039195 [Zingiber officinale]
MEGASGSQDVALEDPSVDPPSIDEPISLPTTEQSHEATPAKKKRKLTLAPSPKQKSAYGYFPPSDVVSSSPDLPLSALYPSLAPSASTSPYIPSGKTALKTVQEELVNYKANEDTRFEEHRKAYLQSSDFITPITNFFINSIKFVTKEGVEQLRELKLLVADPPPNFPDTRRIHYCSTDFGLASAVGLLLILAATISAVYHSSSLVKRSEVQVIYWVPTVNPIPAAISLAVDHY